MKLVIDGKEVPRVKHHFGPGMTIKDIKDSFKEDRPDTTIVSMTLNNGESLAPEIWTTDQYDDITLEFYVNNNLLDGGYIGLETIVLEVQPRRTEPIRQIDIINFIYRHIRSIMNEAVYQSIRFESFTREFPNYNTFRDKQRTYLESTDVDKLKFLMNLIEQVEAQTMEYMELDNRILGSPLRGFFLMQGGRIINVS